MRLVANQLNFLGVPKIVFLPSVSGFVDEPSTQTVASVQNATEPEGQQSPQLAKTPVPAPRSNSNPTLDEPQSLHIYQEEPRNLENKFVESSNKFEATAEEESSVDAEAEIPEPVGEAMIPELKEDSESVLQQPFDSLEASNLARDSIEAAEVEDQPQIVISNSGRWAVENQEQTEEEEVEDDIPEDWKEASDLVPVKRCVRVEVTSSESGHATSTSSDTSNRISGVPRRSGGIPAARRGST